MTKTAKLYGGSLYDLAAGERLTERILEEMKAVQQILKENVGYIRLLSEPSVPKADRISLLDQAFGGRIHDYLLNFLKILCENGTLGEWNDCVREFRARYNEDLNIAEANVTSAVPLSEAQTAALTQKLQSLTNKTIILTQKIDSRVIGGLKVELDGMAFDGTSRARLLGLRKKITEIIV